MTTAWQILGGKSPYPYLQGGPESGSNFWIYKGRNCYGGPCDTPEQCRAEAARRLLSDRSYRNTMRNFRKIVKK